MRAGECLSGYWEENEIELFGTRIPTRRFVPDGAHEHVPALHIERDPVTGAFKVTEWPAEAEVTHEFLAHPDPEYVEVHGWPPEQFTIHTDNGWGCYRVVGHDPEHALYQAVRVA